MDVALAMLNAAQSASADQRRLEERIAKLEAEVQKILKLLKSR